MRIIRFLMAMSLLLAAACDPVDDQKVPESPDSPEVPVTPEEPEIPDTPDPDNPGDPDDPEEPDSPEQPETMELVWGADTSINFSDCFGDYYSTGLYMWGLYFMEFETKMQLYVEIICEPQESAELEIPLGEFVASDDKSLPGAMLIGCVEEDYDGVFESYSWYTQLETETQEAFSVPVVDGKMTIQANEDGTHTAVFDLRDDKGNKLTGSYTGVFMIEDFR